LVVEGGSRCAAADLYEIERSAGDPHATFVRETEAVTSMMAGPPPPSSMPPAGEIFTTTGLEYLLLERPNTCLQRGDRGVLQDAVDTDHPGGR
jgi:hypothetical protein